MINQTLRAISCTLLLAFTFTLTIQADDKAEQQIAHNLEMLKSGNERDTARYIALAYETVRMAEVYDQSEGVTEAYRHLIKYLMIHAKAERGYRELEKLRDYTKKTGAGSDNLYTSWQNVVISFFNESNPLRAMTEHKEMLKMAEEEDSDYGMACAHIALGSISEYAYETGIEHFEYAIQYLTKSSHKDRLYYIYYQMAFLAYDNQKYEESMQYLDKMLQVEVKPNSFPRQLEQYDHSLRMSLLFELNDREKATELYNIMKQRWDAGEVHSQFINSYAMSFCIYLCQWGNVNEAGQYLDYIAVPSHRMEVEAFYHKRRGDYRKALELTERLDTLRHLKTVEEQRAKVVNANAFYKNKELAAKNLVLEMVNTKIRLPYSP